MSPTANGLCHSKDCRVTVDPHCWPAAQEQGRGIAGPSLLPQGRREADCMGHAPFSRGLHSKRLILSRKGEVHDLFGTGMGNFWNPESGFPCASRGRDCLGPQAPEGASRCLGSGQALALATATGHCTLACLTLCLRVGSSPQPGLGRHH